MRIRRWVATGFSGLDDFVLLDEEIGPPGAGEVTIEVEAAGVNPADLKHVLRGGDPARLPIPIGYEVAGRIVALGPGVEGVRPARASSRGPGRKSPAGRHHRRRDAAPGECCGR